jgi:hypothetical protein
MATQPGPWLARVAAALLFAAYGATLIKRDRRGVAFTWVVVALFDIAVVLGGLVPLQILVCGALKGVWYRGPFEHNGSVATLEDWFDPARLSPEFTPTGFRGGNVEHRAVPGHEFGLRLTADDKQALIAFLKTL